MTFMQNKNTTCQFNTTLFQKQKNLCSHIPYFPAHKTRFFSPENCGLNSTCVLCPEGKYYFQTYKYLYIFHMKKVTHRVKTNMKMILVAVTTIFWVSMMNKLTSLMAWWSELLTTNHEVPGSIPGSTMCVFP